MQNAANSLNTGHTIESTKKNNYFLSNIQAKGQQTNQHQEDETHQRYCNKIYFTC